MPEREDALTDADRRRALAVARHQRRDASAASPAPVALSSTSSTEDTRSSRKTYCAASTRTEQPAASARIRGTDASAANRSGARNPSAANTSRLPTTWPVAVTGPSARIASKSRSGTRLTRPGTAPARSPGNMIIHIHGTVP
jgi:hypothetical protein